jgi:hypothetical protein
VVCKQVGFTCGTCAQGDSEKKKVSLGCVSPADEPGWKTSFCPFCEGKNRECVFCEGTNRVPFYECPRRLAKDFCTGWLLSHFYRHRASEYNVWPDGGCILNQPVKLIDAFNLFLSLFSKYEEKKGSGGEADD